MVYEGTVVGLKKRSAVVMTGDCQFIKIKRTPAMSGGLTVRFTDADLFKPAVKAPLRFTAIAASLLVCFVVAYSLLLEATGKRAFAYISLEVNPALEIFLDQEMKVLKATGLNRDGRDLVKGLKIRGQDAGEAVQAVLGACVESGYINGDHNRVLLATTFPVRNDKLQEELDHRIWEAAGKGLAASQSGALINIFHVDPALREQAIKNGVSAGRYLLWQDARSNGLQFDLDGPLSGPGFSQAAGRLSLPFAERSITDNNTAPGPASPAMQGGRASQPPSSPPGSGTAPGKMDHKRRDYASPPGVGEGSDNDAEKRGGKQDDTVDTIPVDPGQQESANGKPAAPAEGMRDHRPDSDRIPPGSVKDNRPIPPDGAAKIENNSPPVSDPASGVKEGGSGNADSRSQGTGGSGKSGGKR